MSDKTGIEWTRGDDGTPGATWNPITGCEKVSPGCDHCYAETFAERWRGVPGHHFENGFDVTLRPERLDQPLRWKRPRRIFVNSMSDLFHDAVPDEYIARVFAVMGLAEQHTFQVLTKRHGRMRSLLNSPAFQEAWFRARHERAVQPDVQQAVRRDKASLEVAWPLPNVWLGVSAEDQHWADIRIPALLDTPAAVRFVSAEPLLGPIGLHPYWTYGEPVWGDAEAEPNGVMMQPLARKPGINWLIAGGESGPGARPMHPAWARKLRDDCTASGVPFFFKQRGAWTWETRSYSEPDAYVHEDGRVADEDTAIADGGSWKGMWRVGKKAAGRDLDYKTWDEFPRAAEEVPA